MTRSQPFIKVGQSSGSLTAFFNPATFIQPSSEYNTPVMALHCWYFKLKLAGEVKIGDDCWDAWYRAFAINTPKCSETEELPSLDSRCRARSSRVVNWLFASVLHRWRGCLKSKVLGLRHRLTSKSNLLQEWRLKQGNGYIRMYKRHHGSLDWLMLSDICWSSDAMFQRGNCLRASVCLKQKAKPKREGKSWAIETIEKPKGVPQRSIDFHSLLRYGTIWLVIWMALWMKGIWSRGEAELVQTISLYNNFIVPTSTFP